MSNAINEGLAGCMAAEHAMFTSDLHDLRRELKAIDVALACARGERSDWPDSRRAQQIQQLASLATTRRNRGAAERGSCGA